MKQTMIKKKNTHTLKYSVSVRNHAHIIPNAHVTDVNKSGKNSRELRNPPRP